MSDYTLSGKPVMPNGITSQEQDFTAKSDAVAVDEAAEQKGHMIV